IDNRHRRAQELRLSLTLLTEGPESALAAAREFQAIWQHDPYGKTIEAAALRLLDRDRESQDILDELDSREARALSEWVLAVRTFWREAFVGYCYQFEGVVLGDNGFGYPEAISVLTKFLALLPTLGSLDVHATLRLPHVFVLLVQRALPGARDAIA